MYLLRSMLLISLDLIISVYPVPSMKNLTEDTWAGGKKPQRGQVTFSAEAHYGEEGMDGFCEFPRLILKVK